VTAIEADFWGWHGVAVDAANARETHLGAGIELKVVRAFWARRRELGKMIVKAQGASLWTNAAQ
jgi:hypothetical protein